MTLIVGIENRSKIKGKNELIRTCCCLPSTVFLSILLVSNWGLLHLQELALSNSVRLFCLKLPRLVKLDVAVYFQSVVKIKSLYTLTPAPLASTKLKLVQCECIANGEKPTRWVVIGLI